MPNLPIHPKVIVYHTPAGQLHMVVPIETGRQHVTTSPEAFETRAVKAGEQVMYWARKADGTYEESTLTAPRDGAMMVRIRPPTIRPETDDEFIERRFKIDVPADAVDAGIILATNVPSDRTFRNGWEKSGGLVQHNMPKCRALQRDRIREVRKAALPALDAEISRLMPAAIAGNATARQAIADLEARRQAWRDAPADPRIDAARSIEELKAITLPEG